MVNHSVASEKEEAGRTKISMPLLPALLALRPSHAQVDFVPVRPLACCLDEAIEVVVLFLTPRTG
jgi:hypothetical protein